MSTETLLIEIGTEELPPTALKTLSESFSGSIIEQLTEAELIENNSSERSTRID